MTSLPSYWYSDDDDSDDAAGIDMTELGCIWCIGGFAPAGTHTVLGLVYTACPYCVETCPCCKGIGLFPADGTCFQCLHEALGVLGYVMTFCHSCAGVLTVTPAGEETTP